MTDDIGGAHSVAIGRSPGFDAQLQLLEEAIASAQDTEDAITRASLIQHLQTAEEELRVADEEVRSQQDELSRLVNSQQARRWQHERLVAVLPAPVVVTTAEGAIKTLNAAAASLLGMRIDRLLRRPIQSLMDPGDRPDVRRRLASAVRRSTGNFRRLVTLVPRHAEPVAVEAVVTVDLDPVTRDVEVTWLLLSPQDHAALTEHPEGPTAVARALVDLTQLPLHAHEAQTVLTRAAEICRRALGAGVEVSVTVGEPAEPTQIASTSPLAQRVDSAQILSGEGPCEEAWRSRETVVSEDLHRDSRWPRLADAMTGIPVLGAVAVPASVGDELLGALNVYGGERLGAEEVATGQLLATAVAAILYEFEVKSELESAARHYQTALTSRATIDQAKGILMVTLGCDADQAFESLAKLSSQQNRKLRDVAADLVRSAAKGTLQPHP